nr:YheC/YheD family protein [Alteribacter salitolerans]
MSKSAALKKHLPETTEYQGIHSIMRMLEKHETLYLKPKVNLLGRGIYRLEKNKNGYILTDSKGTKIHCKSNQNLSKVLINRVNSTYLIQQEIIATASTSKVDFRCYMQRGRNGKWQCSAIETRVAKSDSIITNPSGREKVLNAELGMKVFYNLSPEQISNVIKRIESVCTKVLFNIERNKKYHLGEVAFDLILDKNLHIWLLELQVNIAAETKALMSEDNHFVLPAIMPAPF